MKKRTQFLAAFILTVTSVHGQFNKGDKMLGSTIGTLVFNSGNADISVASIGSNTSKIKNYGVTLNPSFGWFVSGKTVAGATLNINPYGDKTTYEQNGSTYQSDKNSGFNIGLGGFVRNYFSADGSLLPFGQISLNGGISNLKKEGFYYYPSATPYYKHTYSGNSTGGFFLNSTFSAGLTKMISQNTGLDFYIGYNYSYNKNTFKRTSLYFESSTDTNPDEARNETTTKYSNHGFIAGVGFQVFIRSK